MRERRVPLPPPSPGDRRSESELELSRRSDCTAPSDAPSSSATARRVVRIRSPQSPEQGPGLRRVLAGVE